MFLLFGVMHPVRYGMYGDAILMQMTKRFSVTLPDSIFEELEKIADEQGRTTANLAAFLIEMGIRNMNKQFSSFKDKEDK